MGDPPKRFYRSHRDRVLGGVCGGLARYLGTDPLLVRVAWVVVTLAAILVPGIVAYVLLWLFAPEEPPEGTPAEAPPPKAKPKPKKVVAPEPAP